MIKVGVDELIYIYYTYLLKKKYKNGFNDIIGESLNLYQNNIIHTSEIIFKNSIFNHTNIVLQS